LITSKLGDEAGISGYSFSYNVSYFLMSVVYRYELGRDKKLLKFFRGTMDATMIHRYLISGYFNKVIGKRSIENTLYKRGINKALNIYVDIFNEIYKRIPSK
jgi:hypothetical protein